MKRSAMNGLATKRQWQKRSGGWLLAVCCLLLVAACRAPAPEAGRYQWNIVPQGEGRQDQIYVSDTVTGEVAVWDGSSWSPSYMAPLSTPDWKAIRAERKERIKQKEEREKQAKEDREKRDALAKSYAQMPLEKQVAWAKTISVKKSVNGPRSVGGLDLQGRLGRPSPVYKHFEYLKHERGLGVDVWRQPYKATDEGLVVWFNGMADGGSLEFGLSGTPVDSKQIFPAPATIIDDVKAEIKRQEEKQKEAHAENH